MTCIKQGVIQTEISTVSINTETAKQLRLNRFSEVNKCNGRRLLCGIFCALIKVLLRAVKARFPQSPIQCTHFGTRNLFTLDFFARGLVWDCGAEDKTGLFTGTNSSGWCQTCYLQHKSYLFACLVCPSIGM